MATIALVTGANRGIGFEITRQLANKGITVLLSGRNEKKVKKSTEILQQEGLNVTPLVLDVNDEISVSKAYSEILNTYGKLDILINNAAIRIEDYGLKPSEQPIIKWIETFETNLFSVVRVTQIMLPLILKSNAGRIVNVSSLLGSLTLHNDPNSYVYSSIFKSLPAYSASKSALNSWTIHMAFELRNTSIKVNSIHPGYTKTDLNDGEGELSVIEGAKTSVDIALIGEHGPSGKFIHFDNIIPW